MMHNQIISNAEHGFKTQKSATSAIFALNEDILLSLDNKNLTIALFLDLSKAFETVNHNAYVLDLQITKISICIF